MHAESTPIKKTVELRDINTAAKLAINLKVCPNSHEANDLLQDMSIDVSFAEPIGRGITIGLARGERNIRK